MITYCYYCWAEDNKVVQISQCTTAHRTINKTRLKELIKNKIAGLLHQFSHMSLDETTYLYMKNEIDELKIELEKLK